MLDLVNSIALVLILSVLSAVLIISGRSIRLYYDNRIPKYIPKWFFDYLVKEQTYIIKEKYKTYHLIMSWAEKTLALGILLFMIYVTYISKGVSFYLLITLVVSPVVIYLSYKLTSPK